MQKAPYSGTIQVVEKESTTTNPAKSSNRHPVTQEQIDDILDNELKEFEFPIKPVYNQRIRDNGKTVGEMYSWGQLKQIKKIEVGKQDKPDRKFLIDTLLHEFYEAEILKKQYSDVFYAKLSKQSDDKRHDWINEQIDRFFEGKGGNNELG